MTSTMIAELQQQVYDANRRLPDEGLVVLSWGNVSGRSPQGDLVGIKPSGVRYSALRPEDIVVMELDGSIVAGALRPSTDTPTHLALYNAFEELGGIVHAHSTYGTTFAQARRPLPCLGTTHADHFFGTVPVTRPLTRAEVAEHYELNTGKVIVEHFGDNALSPVEMPAVFVAGHAPFAWGPDPTKAVDNAVALENAAQIALGVRLLTGGLEPELEGWVLDVHYQRKHGAQSYYGQAS